MQGPELQLLSLFVAFLAAVLGAEVSQRLRLPGVVGQILAGAVVGPFGFKLLKIDAPIELLAELGAVFLLFHVGLENRLGELRKQGAVAFQVGVLGVLIPLAMATGWAVSDGLPINKAFFVACAFIATSAGITAQVLREANAGQRVESKVILGAAIIDDVLAMLILAVATALATQGGVDLRRLAILGGEGIGFVTVVAIAGSRLMRKSSPLLDAPIDINSPLTVAITICLGLAVAATSTGLAAIIGAFLAGMILAETGHAETLKERSHPITTFLTPFFFVVTGAAVEVKHFADPRILATLALVTGLAVLSKFIGGKLGARSLGKKSAAIVGVGMIPRGEVGIVIASLGERAGVFSGTLFSVIVGMTLLTSVLAPPVLSLLLRRHPVAE